MPPRTSGNDNITGKAHPVTPNSDLPYQIKPFSQYRKCTSELSFILRLTTQNKQSVGEKENWKQNVILIH